MFVLPILDTHEVKLAIRLEIAGVEFVARIFDTGRLPNKARCFNRRQQNRLSTVQYVGLHGNRLF